MNRPPAPSRALIPNLNYYQPPSRCVPLSRETECLVYGATSAGVMAAVQMSRLGHRVLVVDPSPQIGGMTASGLGFTDVGNRHAIGGMAAEFYRAVGSHYGTDWQTSFEPHVARKVLQTFLDAQAVEVLHWQFLESVEKEADRLVSASFESGLTVRARIFIDATYEGDLAAMAGVGMTVGREPESRYGESRNGVRVGPHHQFSMVVDPYVQAGVPSSGLLPGIESGPVGREGEGDHRVQAYCFRMCMTDRPENRRPFPKPGDYSAENYELLARVLATGWNEVFRKFDRIPNGKTDTNNHGPVSSDYIGGSHRWPFAGYLERERIFQSHIEWQAGLYHFLSTDPRVPRGIQDVFNTWGLASDEFPETGGWPHQIYVREGRRMVSEVVMTEKHCTLNEWVDDPVALAAYQMDSHNCRRVVREGRVFNEGDVQVKLGKPYGISFRSTVPRTGECGNLAVACAISSSHIAFGSLRMEPVFMLLGQSAACAGHLAMENHSALQDIPYAELKSQLLAVGQILHSDTTVKNIQTGE